MTKVEIETLFGDLSFALGQEKSMIRQNLGGFFKKRVFQFHAFSNSFKDLIFF